MAADSALKVGMIDQIESIQSNVAKIKINLNSSIQDTPKTQNPEDTMIKMLSEFLASNPEAKADFDTMIAEAKTEAIKAEREETESLYKSIDPIIKSKE